MGPWRTCLVDSLEGVGLQACESSSQSRSLRRHSSNIRLAKYMSYFMPGACAARLCVRVFGWGVCLVKYLLYVLERYTTFM